LSTTPAGEKVTELAGGCLCGAVNYRVVDAFAYAANCHCSDCRRATGSAFKPFAGTSATGLRIVAGADHLLLYGDPSENHDVHCRDCGSLLYSVVGAGRIHLALGSLHDAPSIKPRAHIFVGDKAPWHEITDSLPQFAGPANG
jgi:hypothetical protein